jgi:hypothetical protein
MNDMKELRKKGERIREMLQVVDRDLLKCSMNDIQRLVARRNQLQVDLYTVKVKLHNLSESKPILGVLPMTNQAAVQPNAYRSSHN